MQVTTRCWFQTILPSRGKNKQSLKPPSRLFWGPVARRFLSRECWHLCLWKPTKQVSIFLVCKAAPPRTMMSHRVVEHEIHHSAQKKNTHPTKKYPATINLLGANQTEKELLQFPTHFFSNKNSPKCLDLLVRWLERIHNIPSKWWVFRVMNPMVESATHHLKKTNTSFWGFRGIPGR